MATDKRKSDCCYPSWLKGGEVDSRALKREAEICFRLIKSEVVSKQKEGLGNLHDLITLSWSLEDTRLARDAADLICDLTRTSNTLERMLSLAVSSDEKESKEDEDLRLKSLTAIEQIMVAENRQYIANHHLFPSLVSFASLSTSLERMRCGTGIYENLFKVSPPVSLQLIESGGLQTVMLCCRENDSSVIQHCAAALANCALYGSPKVHREMLSKSADHWLFPLAFSRDSAVKYYALIAICLLAADQELLPLVKRSGTLELVIPFLRLQDPLEFPKTCPNHAHGRTASWLERVTPLLTCSSEEAQSLAAFHFAMEACIKQKQNRLKVSYLIFYFSFFLCTLLSF
ncbi:PREDICTED: sterile alpha and TIR motif-containing protein 1-like [Amphimedon queenslandica]|uniref:Uncharacterized protein n=1 Tax=Amphimedon queenslandica TaxID=400682 RepID=A0AAN0IF22_AMPQE|nr:PREDICTED: sterile alpha and TIR motif-containing protein 1-like [Amphimedon queenslandica]|eukprot:XP_003387119.1 PREDICTED: sterile alpha and TIR motif-containing protein 1-like [Amphimedon queenslandica]